MFKLLGALALALVAASACSSGQPTSASPASSTTTATAAPATAGTVAPATRSAIAAAVQKLSPGARVQSILPSPIAGLYQVIAQGQVLYMTADGRYVIQGNAYDIQQRVALNSAPLDRLRRDAIAKLQPGQVIRFAPPDPKYTVTVFTDVDCPYCRAFHANIDEINKLGIAVDYLLWPRTGLGTPSARKAADVWCSANRRQALTAAFEGHDPKPATCDAPVARDFNLGLDLGVEGTPTIIAQNGVVLGGYIDAHELLRRLEEVEASARGG